MVSMVESRRQVYVVADRATDLSDTIAFKFQPEESDTLLEILFVLDDIEHKLLAGRMNEHKWCFFSPVCPHNGAIVGIDESGAHWRCSGHNYTFRRDGGGLNVSNLCLTEIAAEVRGGLVTLPERILAHLAIGHGNQRRKRSLTPDVNITFHAHACVTLEFGGTKILCDPWLTGFALTDAWCLYPPPLLRREQIAELQPDLIWVSHEHSDHLHEETLDLFDRSTPIWFHSFNGSGRIEHILRRRLGFKNCHRMEDGKAYNVLNVRLSAFMVSNGCLDSALSVEYAGRRLINLNDAGFMRHMAEKTGPADIILSNYTSGASAFPLCWTHLSMAQQEKWIDRNCRGAVKLLEDTIAHFNPSVVFPIASGWALWRPEHRELELRNVKNTPNEVKALLESKFPVDVVVMAPGETWSSARGRVNNALPEISYRKDDILKYIEATYADAVRSCQKFDRSYSADAVNRFVIAVNELGRTCPDVDCLFRLKREAQADRLILLFTRGSKLLWKELDRPARERATGVLYNEVVIEEGFFAYWMEERVAFDELKEGFYLSFSRDPDIYTPDFWNILNWPEFSAAKEG